MDLETTSTASSTMYGSKFFGTYIDHTRLVAIDAGLTWVFLGSYDQYGMNINEGAKQLVLNDTVSIHVFKLVQLNVCVDF